jgi:ribosomal protein L14
MVYVQTYLKIIDNTGGFYALCIRILTNSKLARPGDCLVITVKSVVFNKKVLFQKKRKVFKGEVKKAVLLRSGSIKNRNGFYFKSKTNGVAIIGK